MIKLLHFNFPFLGDEDYSINEKRQFDDSNSTSKFTTEEGTVLIRGLKSYLFPLFEY